MVILKIPIVYLCSVVYYAIKAEPHPPSRRSRDGADRAGRVTAPVTAGGSRLRRRPCGRTAALPDVSARAADGTSRAGRERRELARLSQEQRPRARRETRRRLSRRARDLREPDRARLASASAIAAGDLVALIAAAMGGRGQPARARGGAHLRPLLLLRPDDRRRHEPPALVARRSATGYGGARATTDHDPEVDGLNAGYAALLLEQYLDNPSAVPSEWRSLFEQRPEDAPCAAARPRAAARAGRARRRRRPRAVARRLPSRRRRPPRRRPSSTASFRRRRRGAARRCRRRDGARQGPPHARTPRCAARSARLRAPRRPGARARAPDPEADARADGAHPGVPAPAVRRGRDARRRVPAAARDVLRHDRL